MNFSETLDGVVYRDPEKFFAAARERDQKAVRVFERFLEENKSLLQSVVCAVDGEGGALIEILKRVLEIEPAQRLQGCKKKKISSGLRKQVFERDAYRCKSCGDHKNLCLDHVYPESLGGESSLENLQTLCQPCNSKKGVKVPQEEQ